MLSGENDSSIAELAQSHATLHQRYTELQAIVVNASHAIARTDSSVGKMDKTMHKPKGEWRKTLPPTLSIKQTYIDYPDIPCKGDLLPTGQRCNRSDYPFKDTIKPVGFEKQVLRSASLRTETTRILLWPGMAALPVSISLTALILLARHVGWFGVTKSGDCT